MIMPGRIWVAGIDIAGNNLLQNNDSVLSWRKAGGPHFPPDHFPPHKAEKLILHSGTQKGNLPIEALIVKQLHWWLRLRSLLFFGKD
jgi:hypothetical protein